MSAAGVDHVAPLDASAAPGADSYTPLQTSVRLLSHELRTNATLLSALGRFQSFLPDLVTEAAVASASRAKDLTLHYATPLAERLDARLDAAIHTLLSAPAQAQARVEAADQFVYSHTPALLKPTYSRGRDLALSTVNAAATSVAVIKTQRVDPLVARVRAKVELITAGLRDVRHALTHALSVASSVDGKGALLAAHARLVSLQARLISAVSAAGERVRSSQASLAALSHDLAAQLAHLAQLVEQQLVASGSKQAAQLRHLFARVQEGVAGLKESLAVRMIGSGSAPSSRSSSNASAAESDASEESDSLAHRAAALVSAAVAPAAAAIPAPTLCVPSPEVSGDEHEAEAEHESSPVADSEGETASEEKNGEAAAASSVSRSKKSAVKRRKQQAKRAAQQQKREEEESKQKVAAEDE